MRIAIFDYSVTRNNPIGSCHRRILEGLCQAHEFTVYAVCFENPCPERIRFVRVPALSRPLALLFLTFHVLAPLLYVRDRFRGRSYDLIQFVESNLLLGHVCYAHFCHRAYLRRHWSSTGARGLRGWLRWLDHWLHSLFEPVVYRRVRHVVVPSHGLKRELESEYPAVRGKVCVIPNPIDVERMVPPPEFDRDRLRATLDIRPDAPVLVFVALGHFERKGLHLLLDALRQVPEVVLVVVGGQKDLVRAWQRRTVAAGLERRLRFAGMQTDIRQFLWVADGFVLPSIYEAFPLVTFEAAAARLPLLVTALHGVDEFMRDGETGFLITRDPAAIVDAVRRFVALPPALRRSMGEQARAAVQAYDVQRFVGAWRSFYASLG